MREFVDQIVEWGPLGVFLLSLIDSAGVPLPSFVDAYLITVVMRAPASAVATMLAAIAGSLIGNVILYRLARKGGQLYLDKLIKTERGKKFRLWFEKYGLVTVFVPAVSVVPMPLKFFAVSAAVFRVPLMRVLGVIAVARVIRYGFVAWLAATYGQQTIQFVNQHKLWLGLGAAGLGVAFYVVSRLVSKRPAGASPEELSV
ncbi:MAG: VTT domain-containing protein [Bryobacterales bacterium]|nr:VTT domain-containing protein [Bryobacterales bacterium]